VGTHVEDTESELNFEFVLSSLDSQDEQGHGGQAEKSPTG
jgi:hypothetical protein